MNDLASPKAPFGQPLAIGASQIGYRVALDRELSNLPCETVTFFIAFELPQASRSKIQEAAGTFHEYVFRFAHCCEFSLSCWKPTVSE